MSRLNSNDRKKYGKNLTLDSNDKKEYGKNLKNFIFSRRNYDQAQGYKSVEARGIH